MNKWIKYFLLLLAIGAIQVIYLGWFVCSLVVVIVKSVGNADYLRIYVKKLGYSQSQNGNSQMYPILNLFVKKGGKMFGDVLNDSISHVSGVIRHEKRYKKVGLVLANLHNYIYKLLGDEDHLEESRQREQ